MTDLILGIVLAAILGTAVLYIYKAKKKGVKCIGCPQGSTCGKSHCDCNSFTEHK